jgi:hypothetical protein
MSLGLSSSAAVLPDSAQQHLKEMNLSKYGNGGRVQILTERMVLLGNHYHLMMETPLPGSFIRASNREFSTVKEAKC